jgi:Putative  PD-(D/E)XK family member, (DUF4420)
LIDDVRLALTALRSRDIPAPGDLSVVAVAGRPDVLVGLDELRRSHLLLRLDGSREGSPTSDVAALQISIRPLAVDGRSSPYLDVTCLFESVTEVFEHFIAAVLDRMTAAGDEPVTALRGVLEKWRQFLVPAGGPPGRDKLAAVLGELLVVRDLASIDASRALQAWVGPFGSRHDFRRANTALEIKTTQSHTSRRVTIHGEDQLEEPDGGTLYLHLVRLEHVAASGDSVASIADDLFARGVAVDAVFDALAAAGVPPAELAATAEIRFDVRERLTVPIDDATPRLVSSSFAHGARPVGIVDLSYVIDLDHVLGRALTDQSYHSLLSELVAGI